MKNVCPKLNESLIEIVKAFLHFPKKVCNDETMLKHYFETYKLHELKDQLQRFLYMPIKGGWLLVRNLHNILLNS